MTGLASRLRLITGRSLLSVPAIVVFVAMSMSPNVMFDILTQHGAADAWLLASSIATLAGVAVVLACRPILQAVRTPSADSALAVAVLAGAATVKSAVIALLAGPATATWPVHVESAVPIAQRTLTNLAYTLLGVGITCAVVTRSREHRERRRWLMAEQQRLVAASATIADRLRSAEEELRIETHAVLDPALAEVRAALEPSAGDPDTARVLESLNAAVSDVIRPMSHRYARETPVVSLPSADAGEEFADAFGWVNARIDVPAAIRPLLILVLSAAAFLLIAPLAAAPPRAYVVAAAMYLVTSLVLFGVRAAWPQRWRLMTGGAGMAWLLGVYLVVFSITGVVFNDPRLIGDWQRFGLMSTGYRSIISMAISMTVVVGQQRIIVDAGIEEVNAQLLRHVSVLRRELWAIRRRMSLVLHGSVQSALISAMLLLRADSGPASVAEVRQRLDQALTAIDLDEQASAVIEHGLREIGALWSGIAEVSVDMSADAASLLADQPGLSSVVLEIVREGVGNALRHGRATHVTTRIDLVDPGLVSVVVRDDGHGLGEGTEPGLGSRMLDEVCVGWQRESLTTGVELRALLA